MAIATHDHCGETHDVTAGACAWDVGTCFLVAGHRGECDYQVNEPTPVETAYRTAGFDAMPPLEQRLMDGDR